MARIRSESDRRTATLFRPVPEPIPDMLRVGDLFAEIGGTAAAARQLGLEVVYAVEGDADARRAYTENTGLRPRARIPRLFDNVPPFEILVVNLPGEATDDDALERRRSPFQEAARLLRVRRPLGVIFRGPSGWGAIAVTGELERISYTTTMGDCGGHPFVVGTLRPDPLIWPIVDECRGAGGGVRAILCEKGFPDGWAVPENEGLAEDLVWRTPPVPVWRAVLGSVLGVVKGEG